jgi:GDP-L-fucose synthase
MKIIITGGSGFLGSHLCTLLAGTGYEIFIPRSADYDLRLPADVAKMFEAASGAAMLINLAANVGGIGYNQNHPYQLFYDNIQMCTNVIHQAIGKIEKLIQVGTVCAYPKWARPPFREEMIWDGYPEETNAPYGLAKKMALVQLQAARQEYDFNGIYLLPTNLYGPGDEFADYRSHVIPALIKKFIYAVRHDLPEVEVWGTGKVSRDFLHVTDAARAIIMAMEGYSRPEPLNIGSGQQTAISALAYHISELAGFKGNIRYDTSKPDGQPKRGLDIGRIKQAVNWQPEISLIDGLRETIKWYEETYADREAAR